MVLLDDELLIGCYRFRHRTPQISAFSLSKIAIWQYELGRIAATFFYDN